MKKYLTLAFLMTVLMSMTGYGQAKSYPNPSVAYIEKMGFEFLMTRDAEGNEQGQVNFPDGSRADAWDFLRGKAGAQYSYCAKKGYSTESETIDHGSWTEVITVCKKTDENGRESKIPMTELMEKNGEPLVLETAKQETTDPGEYPEDPNLKSALTLPTSFDWRSYNGHSYIGPVRNQGSCGACYAFGANANAEGVYNFATGNYDGNCMDLSESFIIWCMSKVPPYSYHFNGCSGADYQYYELKALVDSGVTYESYFPYTVTDPGVCTHWNNPRIRFNNWYRVPCSDIEGIKTAIMTYGVVDAAVYATSAFQGYAGGVFSDTLSSCSSYTCYYTPTNHAIALVGWGVDPVKGEYWILRNSWGSGWGEGGYMRITTTSARVACEVAYLTYAGSAPVQGPPLATTAPASGISTGSATVNGTVNANNLSTTTTFEYGLTTAYSGTMNSTPGVTSGNQNTPVTASLAGLQENTTYHFRVKAVNSMGTAYGSDMNFTTPPSSPPPPIGCQDNYEPNNAQSAAKPVGTGTEIFGLINPSDDTDWFSFSSTGSQKNVKVELYNLPADYDVDLYDSKGKLLGRSQNRGATSELIIYNSSKAGTYYVKVYGYGGAFHATTCYSLKASLSNTAWKSFGPIASAPRLDVYPNPTSGRLNVDYTAETTGKWTLRVFSMTGATMLETEFIFTKGLNTHVIDLSGNSPGIYFLELTGDQDRLFRKIMLQK